MEGVIEVAAGLVGRDGKLLITQRLPDAHLAGFWEFPGGKREASETFEECLQRELREEVGIDVEVGNLIEELTHPYPGKTVHLKFYQCRWLRHEPKPIFCHDIAWIGRDELAQYHFPPADARLLGKLVSNWTEIVG